MLVALALAFGLLLGGITPASGQTQGQTGPLPNAGVLRLRLGAADHFRYEPPSGSPTTTQTIVPGSACRFSLAPLTPPGDLVSFSAAQQPSGNANPGFVGDSIGVKGTGEGGGSPCGRIDPGQSLTMDLGPALGGKLVDFAEIDLEGKFGATIKVEGWIVTPSSTKLVKTEFYNTAISGNDSGPDSGDGDNFRSRFPKAGFTAVNRLVFSIDGSTGAASLEGGSDGTSPCDGFLADGTTPDPNEAGCQAFSLGKSLSDDEPDPLPGTTDSLFHLVTSDGILDCNGAPVSQGGNGTPLNVLKRLDNATGLPTECIPIPFDLNSSVNGTLQQIVLLKNLFGQDAQFEWTVTWAPETGSYMEDETKFDFDGDNIFTAIQLCLADGPDANVNPDLPPSQEAGDPPGTIDPWCVKKTTTTLIVGGVDNGKVFVEETYFGTGDPTGRR